MKKNITEDNNNRIVFQLLSSAFVQIDDEDAREILATLACEALCAIRPTDGPRQQEWRVWMGPKDNNSRSWWRDYKFHQEGDAQMNKLTALSKLASAYHYIAERSPNGETVAIIAEKFGYIRRSLRLEDLMPQPRQTAEGLNPAGPKFF